MDLMGAVVALSVQRDMGMDVEEEAQALLRSCSSEQDRAIVLRQFEALGIQVPTHSLGELPVSHTAAPESTPALPPAEWHPDPTGRHQLRYWDGAKWTHDVADDGVVSADPL